MEKEISSINQTKIPKIGEISNNIDNKINIFVNLILDRIADDLKNNCLKIPLKN